MKPIGQTNAYLRNESFVKTTAYVQRDLGEGRDFDELPGAAPVNNHLIGLHVKCV